MRDEVALDDEREWLARQARASYSPSQPCLRRPSNVQASLPQRCWRCSWPRHCRRPPPRRSAAAEGGNDASGVYSLRHTTGEPSKKHGPISTCGAGMARWSASITRSTWRYWPTSAKGRNRSR